MRWLHSPATRTPEPTMSTPNWNLQGRVAVITGGAQGDAASYMTCEIVYVDGGRLNYTVTP